MQLIGMSCTDRHYQQTEEIVKGILWAQPVKRRISVFELFHPFPNSTHTQFVLEKFYGVDCPTCLDSKQTIGRQ